MDVRLPGIDGLALTRLLRADPKHRSLIIVAITANAFAADRHAAMAAGDAYVSKPIDTAGRTTAHRSPGIGGSRITRVQS